MIGKGDFAERERIFRGNSAAASLKREIGVGRIGIDLREIFRGNSAAASLKLDDRQKLITLASHIFRGNSAAASLKQSSSTYGSWSSS